MEKNKINVRKGILIGCIISAALLLGFLGSYAYFIGAGNNSRPENVKVQTGNMAITFSDGSASFQGSLSFGESATKTFTIENTGSLEANAKINWKNLTNTYLADSLTYTLSYSEEENGTYTELVTKKQVPKSETPITKTLVNNLSIPIGKTYYYKLVITLNYLETIDQTADLSAMLSTEFSLSEIEDEVPEEKGIIPQMVQSIIDKSELPANSVKTGNPTFANAATTDETADGLYSMADDSATSYYFRGAVENNYVNFAGFFWRIIRINGDGSLRMIYDGDKAYANDERNDARFINVKTYYNSAGNDAKYVGYMFGPTGTDASYSKTEAQSNLESSYIKNIVDEWYKTNIADKNFSTYVADEIFCNDRSIVSGNGYGKNNTTYAGYRRFVTNANSSTPTFKCTQTTDKFTVSSDIGNGALTYPVGLITMDEVMAAGNGKLQTNNLKYYLYKSFNVLWTMTPYSMESSSQVFTSYTAGFAEMYPVQIGSASVAPVINIKAEYAAKLLGSGTMDSPYRLNV